MRLYYLFFVVATCCFGGVFADSSKRRELLERGEFDALLQELSLEEKVGRFS